MANLHMIALQKHVRFFKSLSKSAFRFLPLRNGDLSKEFSR